jgi:hypothetical protein
MANAKGESRELPLRLVFDRRIKMEFHGARISSDGGLLACSWVGILARSPSVVWLCLALLFTGCGTTRVLLVDGNQSLEGSPMSYTEVSEELEGVPQVEVYEPYLEFSLVNTSWSGNPYDVEAAATFTFESNPAIQRSIQMFYVGANTWKFRFTGDRIGVWSVETNSADSQLDGYTARVNVTANSNADATGFLVASGNKYARQVNGNSSLKPFIPNIYYQGGLLSNWGEVPHSEAVEDALIAEALEHGMNGILISLNHHRFELGAYSYEDHNSTNPDPAFFDIIDRLLEKCRNNDLMLHMWNWGDEARKVTPIGLPGGVNGDVDNRATRYMAARWGMHPNWSMSYGFDLHEWASASEVQAWHDYFQARLPHDHLLTARSEASYATPSEMNWYSTDERFITAQNYYDKTIKYLGDAASSRPMIYERRFAAGRDDVWFGDNTRRSLWQFAMAGGASAIYGYFAASPLVWDAEDKASFVIAKTFWDNYNRLGFSPDNGLASTGYVLRDGDSHMIVYVQNTNSVVVDLSDLAGATARVTAVNAIGSSYSEVDLGNENTSSYVTISLPSTSDWGVAIQSF